MKREYLLVLNLSVIVFCCLAIYNDPRPWLNLTEGIFIGINAQMVVDNLTYLHTQRSLRKEISEQMAQHSKEFGEFLNDYFSKNKIPTSEAYKAMEAWAEKKNQDQGS